MLDTKLILLTISCLILKKLLTRIKKIVQHKVKIIKNNSIVNPVGFEPTLLPL